MLFISWKLKKNLTSFKVPVRSWFVLRQKNGYFVKKSPKNLNLLAFSDLILASKHSKYSTYSKKKMSG